METDDKILKVMVDTMNDINAYLERDIPMELHQHDIDYKLNVMKDEVMKLLNEYHTITD